MVEFSDERKRLEELLMMDSDEEEDDFSHSGRIPVAATQKEHPPTWPSVLQNRFSNTLSSLDEAEENQDQDDQIQDGDPHQKDLTATIGVEASVPSSDLYESFTDIPKVECAPDENIMAYQDSAEKSNEVEESRIERLELETLAWKTIPFGAAPQQQGFRALDPATEGVALCVVEV